MALTFKEHSQALHDELERLKQFIVQQGIPEDASYKNQVVVYARIVDIGRQIEGLNSFAQYGQGNELKKLTLSLHQDSQPGTPLKSVDSPACFLLAIVYANHIRRYTSKECYCPLIQLADTWSSKDRLDAQRSLQAIEKQIMSRLPSCKIDMGAFYQSVFSKPLPEEMNKILSAKCIIDKEQLQMNLRDYAWLDVFQRELIILLYQNFKIEKKIPFDRALHSSTRPQVFDEIKNWLVTRLVPSLNHFSQVLNSTEKVSQSLIANTSKEYLLILASIMNIVQEYMEEFGAKQQGYVNGWLDHRIEYHQMLQKYYDYIKTHVQKLPSMHNPHKGFALIRDCVNLREQFLLLLRTPDQQLNLVESKGLVRGAPRPKSS